MDQVNPWLDTRLTPDLAVASAHWRRGARTSAVAHVAQLLGADPTEPLVLIRSIPREGFTQFEEFLGWALSHPDRLAVPTARLASLLWRELPSTDALTAILMGDYRWTDNPYGHPKPPLPELHQLAEVIAGAVQIGAITRLETELFSRGRPVLLPGIVEIADPAAVGPLLPAVTETRALYTDEQWWSIAAEDYPAVVFRWFVRGVCQTQYAAGASTLWRIVERDLPAYAEAVRQSWRKVQQSASEQDWETANQFLTENGEDLRDSMSGLLGT